MIRDGWQAVQEQTGIDEVSALAAAARGGILRAAFVVRAAGVEPAQRLRAEGF
jgi:hypothetical protein